MGEWTFFLPVHTEGRFPKAEEVIPAAISIRSRLRLAAEDAAFLARTLPLLPGGDEENAPVTVDLNGQAIIRAQGPGQDRPTEVVLARSVISGQPGRSRVNRELLGRALALGLAPSRSSMATRRSWQDERTQYVFMPLGSKTPSRQCRRRAYRLGRGRPTPAHFPFLPEATSHETNPESHLPQRNGNGRHRPGSDGANRLAAGGHAGADRGSRGSKALLRDGYTRVSGLLAALKRQQQQSKLLHSTVTAPRQLQDITP